VGSSSGGSGGGSVLGDTVTVAVDTRRCYGGLGGAIGGSRESGCGVNAVASVRVAVDSSQIRTVSRSPGCDGFDGRRISSSCGGCRDRSCLGSVRSSW
jgi:hypothetical protein